MTINIPYEIGEVIETEFGAEPIVSMHIYIDKNGEVSNVRAFTQVSKYTTLMSERENK